MNFILRHIYTLLAIATVAFLLPIVGIAKADTAATAIVSETQDTSATEEAAAPKPKCQVCHHAAAHPHTINISCNAVAKHLANHPDDTEGPCQNVTDEKPPKPSHPKG